MYSSIWHIIRLTRSAKLDILAWLHFLQMFNGKSLILDEKWLSSTISLYTDSATTNGYAAVYGSQWLNGGWPPSWEDSHIPVLELYPIVAALKTWGNILSNSCVMFHCDNKHKAVVDIINNTSGKDPVIMILVRQFVALTMTYYVMYKACHVPGVKNGIADLHVLSRFQVDEARKLVAPWLDLVPPQLADLEPDTLPQTILFNTYRYLQIQRTFIIMTIVLSSFSKYIHKQFQVDKPIPSHIHCVNHSHPCFCNFIFS